MKQKDLVLIVVAVFVSGFISYLLSGFLISAPKNRQEKVEVVEPITADFTEPSKKYFNEQSVDPTQTITIGVDSNNQPFKSE